MQEETESWLILSEARGLGASDADRLLERFGTATAVATASRADLLACGIGSETAETILTPDRDYLARVAEWLEEPNHHAVSRASADYPELLGELPDAPLLLYVNGDPACVGLPQLAIVGSRNPTAGGYRSAREFSAHLATGGLTITSGLAAGIDTAAHEGALSAGAATIAVLGTGIDRVYPAANRDLAHRIAAGGALVSEFSLGSGPLAWHFPRRNRIIAGLALGTLVVEAARRSGSLITARLAAEQGREVFAMPGSIHNALARGCHRLIRDGARLVESADDIFAELEPLVGTLRSRLIDAPDSVHFDATSAGRDEDYDKLLAAMGWDPVDMDTLVGSCGLTIDQLSSMLLILELEGEVESLPGGRFSRIRQERQA